MSEHRSHYPPQERQAVGRNLELAKTILDACDYGTWDVQMTILATVTKVAEEALAGLGRMREHMLKEQAAALDE